MTLIRQNLVAAFLVLIGALTLAIPQAAAEDPIELEWDDLIPKNVLDDLNRLSDGVITGEEVPMSPYENPDYYNAVTEEYDGKTVRMPGFVVPIEYSGVGVTSLLLVPYVGACIHVPPPPPNQLVYVTTDKPYEFKGLFEAVWITGNLTTTPAETDYAEAGYTISDGRVEPYEW